MYQFCGTLKNLPPINHTPVSVFMINTLDLSILRTEQKSMTIFECKSRPIRRMSPERFYRLWEINSTHCRKDVLGHNSDNQVCHLILSARSIFLIETSTYEF